VLSADISSGNIGQNVRNDIQWYDAWVVRLTETENFFREYIKTPPPYDLVYSTDVETGATNYQNRTVALSFGIELLPASMEWFDTMEKEVKIERQGLEATGRAEAWGFNRTVKDRNPYGVGREVSFSWPDNKISQGLYPFADQNKTFTIVAELVNENGVTLGRQSIPLAYGWTFDFSAMYRTAIKPKPGVRETVTFPAVKADLITDKLTIKIISVDGVAAERVGRDGHIRITTKADYNKSPQSIASREANAVASFTFEYGTITRYNSSGPRDVYIPPTIQGTPVKAIGRGAFVLADDNRYIRLTSITLPENVNILYGGGIYGDFSVVYDKNGKRAGTYIIIEDSDPWGGGPRWSYTGQ
jgi:hypothetical protein